MKSYYDAHETAYQRIKANGYVGWGDAKTITELGDEKTKAFLNNLVPRFMKDTSGRRALDLGCGTGTTAFVLARLGFEVTGLDISNTAIEMARDLARIQDLSIRFETADVLSLQKLETKFDLIYDSHCLHCIVFDEDRIQVLAGVRESLASGGLFVLDTMVMPPAKVDLKKNFAPLRFDENYILWHETSPSADRGVIKIDDHYWCAQRRIYPAEVILLEIANAGFKVLAKEIGLQLDEPTMLRMVLSHKEGF